MGTAGTAPVAAPAALLAALPGDLLLAQLAAVWRDGLSWSARDGAVALQHLFGDEPEWCVVGDPGGAYHLACDLAGELPAARDVSVPRVTGTRLLAEGWTEREGWAFRATRVPPGLPVEGVAWLPPEADGEVRELLAVAFPDASLPVGHPNVRRWAGLRRDGRLVAVAADATVAEGLGFLASIATAPDVRGTGAGAAVTAWATAELVREHGACGLWHMAGNAVASGLYARLGYSDDHRMAVVAAPGAGAG
ncbi:MAG TPA: GNAT family N-acetyltransferase [Mycobacteriales bacterium]